MKEQAVKAMALVAKATQPMWYAEKREDIFTTDFDHWQIANLAQPVSINKLGIESKEDYQLQGTFLIIQTPSSQKARVFENPDLIISDDCVIFAIDENSTITKA